VLRPLHHPTDELARSVQDKIAEVLGRPLRPEAVRFVTQLPKTRNAKILRRVIRGAYLGKSDLGDLSSLENPAAVEEVRALAKS
jgi:acetyl-CoA synthetase